LLSQFEADNSLWDYKLDADDYVTHISFAYCHCLDLFELYPEVLLLDCTYQINQDGILLFNMVGTSGVKLSFLVGCAFLHAET
jgi:hypothetical protein